MLTIQEERQRSKRLNDQPHQRFRLLLNIAKGCYGNCQGCSLSTTERKESTSQDVPSLAKYLSAFKNKINQNEHLNTLVVNLGVGDYLRYDEATLEQICIEVSQFLDQIRTPRKVISFSTSLLSLPEKFEHKIKIIKKYFTSDQIACDVVVDPDRLGVETQTYATHLSKLKDHIEFIDIAVNLHRAIKKESIRDLQKLIQEIEALNLDLQYAIHPKNKDKVAIHPKDFQVFWNELNQILNLDPEKNEGLLSLSFNHSKVDDSIPLEWLIKNQLQNDFEERLAIDESGNVWAVAFGLGDIVLNQDWGLPPVGTVKNGVFEEFKTSQRILKNKLLESANSTSCQTCRFRSLCYGTGYGWYQVAAQTPTCMNPAYVLFQSKQKDVI